MTALVNDDTISYSPNHTVLYTRNAETMYCHTVDIDHNHLQLWTRRPKMGTARSP
jgi:hypothetical protein